MTAIDPGPLSPSTVRLTPSRIRRALRRKVRPHFVNDPHLWIVEGDVDDAYPTYVVRYDPGTGDHACSCYDTGGRLNRGNVGRRIGCTHVVAVVMKLKRQAAIERRNAERKRAVPPTPTVPTPDDPRLHYHPDTGQLVQPPFPDWVQTFRPHQWQATEAIMEAFDDGARVVMLQAPVGTGKTLTGELLRRLIGGNALYVCSTKTLQDQAARDFDYARVLKGRANYPTLSGGRGAWGQVVDAAANTVTCADCTVSGSDPDCRWCHDTVRCPYRLARGRAQTAPLAVLNTAYALTDWNKGGQRFAGRDLCIIDEADLLEGELLSQVEVTISKRRRETLRIPPAAPKTVSRKDPQGTYDAWREWAVAEAIPRVAETLSVLPTAQSATPRELRLRKSYHDLLERLRLLARELPQGGWIHDDYNTGGVTFRPVQVHGWGSTMLWPHARRFLLMSGTIISADEMAESLGVPDGYRLVDIPMTFPAANRPVNVCALVEMSHKTVDTDWPKMLKGVAGVLGVHPEERILVHTVSGKLAEYLVRNLPPSARAGRGIYTYRSGASGERDQALAAYKADPRGVLIAQSMERGVDLPDELCSVIVVCKIPYPNLGDNRTKARLYATKGGEAWYAVNTVRSLVQMTGRGVRHEGDRCTVYVLDHAFTTRLWRKNKRLLPEWWCDAVNWHYPTYRLTRQRS